MVTPALWHRHTLVVFLLVVLGFLVFGQALSTAYLADDYDWLALVASDHSAFDTIETIGTGTYFRPLQLLSLRVEAAVGGRFSPFLHHLSNLSLHLLTALLVYTISFNISDRWYAAAGITLLFLLHPVVVPSVYWISNRGDSLTALFYLLGIWGFLLYIQDGRWPAFFLVVVGLLGSLLAKEMGVTLVLALAVLWLILKLEKSRLLIVNRRKVGVILGLLSLITLSYLSLLWLWSYQGTSAGLLTIELRQLPELLVAGFMVLILPNNESLLTDLYTLYPALLPLVLLLLGLLTAAGIWWLSRKRSLGSVRLFLLLGLLFLVSLLPLVFSGANTRRMYLPWAVACVALSFLPLVRSRRFLLFLLLPLLPLATASYIYGRTWVHNWQLTEVYCESFREVMEDIPVDAGLLFMAVPGRARDVALFSNDADPALYHCLTGEHGYFSRFLYVSQFRTNSESPKPDDFSLRQVKPDAYRFEIAAPDSYFYLWLSPQPGEAYESENLTITIDDVNHLNQVSAFTVALPDSEAVSDIYAFYFSGLQIETVEIR